MNTPAGLPIALARLRTRDDVYLDGVFAEPSRRSETALVWVHGLGSVFSSGQPLIRELSVRLTRAGVGYFKFNTRGHDVVAGRGRTLAGAAFERFRDCVLDFRAVIAFARRRGYRKIILAGHSTGANKVLYYAAKIADRRVTGLILLGPISDIAGEAKRIGRRELGRRVARASRLAAKASMSASGDRSRNSSRPPTITASGARIARSAVQRAPGRSYGNTSSAPPGRYRLR